jgi:RNA polymerase sigma-70 factor, ECF subfamily
MQQSYTEVSDKVLVKWTRQGNGNAFGELYDRYFEKVYAYLYLRISNKHDAEDLTETVFLRTLDVMLNKKTNIKNFKAWLFSSAHNLLVDHYRSKKTQVDIDEVENLPELVNKENTNPLDGSDRILIRTAIEKLEPNLQQVIAYRFIADLSYTETAEIMGLKENHLRVLQHRALKQLRVYLSKDFKDDER